MKLNYWLVKSEPNSYAWNDLRNKSEDIWDGVRNYQARNFMRDMKIGDRGFFYLSQKEKSIVGIVEVITEAHPDSTTDDERWECVDIKAVEALKTQVSLEIVKTDPRLTDMILAKNSRLSVQPVLVQEWRVICALGGLEA